MSDAALTSPEATAEKQRQSYLDRLKSLDTHPKQPAYDVSGPEAVFGALMHLEGPINKTLKTNQSKISEAQTYLEETYPGEQFVSDAQGLIDGLVTAYGVKGAEMLVKDYLAQKEPPQTS